MVLRARPTSDVGFTVRDSCADRFGTCRTSDNVVGSGTISNNSDSESWCGSSECRPSDSNPIASSDRTADRHRLHAGATNRRTSHGPGTSSCLWSPRWRLRDTSSRSNSRFRAGLWTSWKSRCGNNGRDGTTRQHPRSSCCSNSTIGRSSSSSSVDAAAVCSTELRLSGSSSATSATSSADVRGSR